MEPQFLDQFFYLKLQSLFMNDLSTLSDDEIEKMKKIQVEDYNNVDIMISAIFTNIVKNQGTAIKTIKNEFFLDMHSILKEIYKNSENYKMKAIFSHLIHISKIKGLKLWFFEERVLKIRDIKVSPISAKEFEEIKTFHLSKASQKAFLQLWKLLNEGLEMPEEGKFIPEIFVVDGNIPSGGWSGIGEIFLVPKNFNQKYYIAQRQDTAEHEIIHSYNRKVNKNLNHSTPTKESKEFIHKEAGRELSRILFKIMPQWSDLSFQKNSPNCEEIMEKWNKEDNLPIFDLSHFTVEPKILEFGILECQNEEFII